MGARIETSRKGQQDLFAVTRGPIYHLKAVSVEGLSEKAKAQAMHDAPKAGDVYSAGTVNDWLFRVAERFKSAGIEAKVAHKEMKLNHSNATATVVVGFH